MLITGTRKGIGRYLAEYYIDRGFYVYGCSRNPVDFELENYCHYCLNVSDQKEVKKMLSEIRKKHKRLDVLINNAAVNTALLPVMLVPYESALETVEINLLGTFLVSREAAKMMMKNTCGRIVNVSSMAVKHEVEGEAIYTASKAAVISLTRVMAKEFNLYGITCNVIAPAALKTDLIDAVDKQTVDRLLERNAIHEFGKMEDVSNSIDWLIRPESQCLLLSFLLGVKRYRVLRRNR